MPDEAQAVESVRGGVFAGVVHDVVSGDAGDVADGEVRAVVGEGEGLKGFAPDAHCSRVRSDLSKYKTGRPMLLGGRAGRNATYSRREG